MLIARNPDQRKVIINVDASQAEARVVARLCSALSGTTQKMDQLFTQGRKVHVYFASVLYQLREDQIKKDNNPGSMYYTAKRTVHAANYDMGINKMAIVTGQSLLTTRKNMDTFHREFPEIRSIFHPHFRGEIHKTRTLYNAYGRPHTFLDRIGDDLFRRTYAYYPQSTVADLVELAFASLAETARPEWELDILLTTHDSLTFQTLAYPPYIFGATELAKQYMEAPIEIFGQQLIIPSEFTLGRTYYHQHKYSTLESIEHLLWKLGYRHEETSRLHSSLHAAHGRARITRGISLLDSAVVNSGIGEDEHLAE